jgi:hypothetical protein
MQYIFKRQRSEIITNYEYNILLSTTQTLESMTTKTHFFFREDDIHSNQGQLVGQGLNGDLYHV